MAALLGCLPFFLICERLFILIRMKNEADMIGRGTLGAGGGMKEREKIENADGGRGRC